jgi:hypothetical protein
MDASGVPPSIPPEDEELLLLDEELELLSPPRQATRTTPARTGIINARERFMRRTYTRAPVVSTVTTA